MDSVENRCNCACCEMAYQVTGNPNAGGQGCAQVYIPPTNFE